MAHQELLSPKSSTRRGWRRHCLVGQNGEDKDLAKRELYHSDPMGVVYWRQGGRDIRSSAGSCFTCTSFHLLFLSFGLTYCSVQMGWDWTVFRQAGEWAGIVLLVLFVASSCLFGGSWRCCLWSQSSASLPFQQFFLNFLQKDWLRTPKLSSLQCLQCLLSFLPCSTIAEILHR